MVQWLEHRSGKSEGLTFDSSWGLGIFSLSRARDKTKKTSSSIINENHFVNFTGATFALVTHV